MRYFFKWFVFFVSILAGVWICESLFGVLTYIWENDATRISWAIMALFVVTNLWIARRLADIDNEDYMFKHQTQKAWWAADACMAMGMVGTLFGLLIVLSQGFAAVDPSSVESMRQTIGTLASGMGVALLTSLVGLITSFTLKYQIVALESANEDV